MMKKQRPIIFLKLLALVVLLASSCKKELQQTPDISGVASDTTILNIGDKLVLAPNITNLRGNAYTWLLNGKEIASGQVNYAFEATEAGDFEVIFKVSNKGGTNQQSYKIQVEKAIGISLAENLSVSMCQVLEIKPDVAGPVRTDYEYEWSIGDSVISKKLNLNFISVEAGNFPLTLRVTAGRQSVSSTRTIAVKAETYAKNANTLVEYLPSPASNHNWSLVGYPQNWDLGAEFPLPYDEFLVKASAVRKQNNNNFLLVGSWGSSATFKFDHTVVNVSGKTDLELSAYYSYKDIPRVWVAYDANKNGKADDSEWYEIKDADYGQEDIPDYEMTFTFDRAETDARRHYVYWNWKDNQSPAAEAAMVNNKTFASSTTLEGTLSTRGFFPGYVMDINTKQISLLAGWKSSFARKGKRITKDLTGVVSFAQKLNIDIEMAVNAKGLPVDLPGIDFVKVIKVSYPFQKLAGNTTMTDYNMNEARMLQVGAILDKHLKN